MVDVVNGHKTFTPHAEQRDDESYLDFAEGLRAFTQRAVAPVMTERAQQAFTSYEQGAGRKPATIEEVQNALDSIPIVATRNRLMRSTQEMKWVGLLNTYGPRRQELEQALDQADQAGPGTVRWDPNFAYPQYFADARCHLQPGGYWQDPLAGLFYHHGTKVFFTGRNDKDDLQHGIVNSLPAPQDGQVRRVLDLGCSAGQSATAFKDRYPDAEVWGIDISAPMVRYAHKRAVDLGTEVHFAQMPAEKLDFPDASFDIVHAFILFHEIPTYIAEQVVAEAYRVLRPGGVFAVEDFGNRPPGVTAPLADYTRHFDTHHNGERFASQFVYSDFPGMLKKAGFRSINTNYDPKAWIPVRVCEK